jgi:hypothetical protein
MPGSDDDAVGGPTDRRVIVKNTSRLLKACLSVVAVSSLFSGCIPERYQTGLYTPRTESSKAAAVAEVNGLPYSYRSMELVIAAFRVVTFWRGWTQAETESWVTAVRDIALKEAQGCWNVRYGARFAYWDGRDCKLSRAGRGAAGYGQITQVLMPAVCRRTSICTQSQVVASPWNSMTALVGAIEENGVRPWCYDSFSRRFHRVACSNPGVDVG